MGTFHISLSDLNRRTSTRVLNMNFRSLLLRCFLFVSVFTLLCLAVTATCEAQDPFVVSVEEEWSLQVGEPNLIANAPQVSMVMSSNADLEDDYFMFVLNHRTHPAYQAGGLQLQQWNGATVEDFANDDDESLLENTNEVVTWKQAMTIQNGTVTVAVQDGVSTSWGAFGNDGALTLSAFTGQPNLNAYTPSVSLSQSGIAFAGNRVGSLTLQKVTWTMSDGQKYYLTAPIDIDNDDLDPWN
jgi:hypothetical protein